MYDIIQTILALKDCNIGLALYKQNVPFKTSFLPHFHRKMCLSRLCNLMVNIPHFRLFFHHVGNLNIVKLIPPLQPKN